MLEVAVIGAGPYGLSIAAYFRRQGIHFRIFGRPMDSWRAHMPKGMFLKSDGFASNIYDPERAFTLRQFCDEKGIEYSDAGLPVGLDTFTAYGLAFIERMVPELEDTTVVSVDRVPQGFLLRTANGEAVTAKRVVLAIGITHFEHTPGNLAHLPPGLLSHSYHHQNLQSFKDRKVIVIGAGASATDIAGLLHEAGSDVNLVARPTSLSFHTRSMGKQRSLWQRIRRPQSGLGPGWKSRFFSDAPAVFHCLPEHLRIEAVRRTLGPSGGWFAKDKVIGHVPLLLGCTPERAEPCEGGVCLHLRATDGTRHVLFAEHIIAATGYKVDLGRLTFLHPEIRSNLKTLNATPILSSSFESSVPGLHFVGLAAANSFGPVMRFAFGAGFTARNLSRVMERSLAKVSVSVPAPHPIPVTRLEAREPLERPLTGTDKR